MLGGAARGEPRRLRDGERRRQPPSVRPPPLRRHSLPVLLDGAVRAARGPLRGRCLLEADHVLPRPPHELCDGPIRREGVHRCCWPERGEGRGCEQVLFAELATVLPDAALEALLPPGGPAAELLLRAAPALTVALELAIGRLLFL